MEIIKKKHVLMDHKSYANVICMFPYENVTVLNAHKTYGRIINITLKIQLRNHETYPRLYCVHVNVVRIFTNSGLAYLYTKISSFQYKIL